MEAETGIPGDLICASAKGQMGRSQGTEHGQRGTGHLSQPLRDARTAGPVAVFVPPAIFGEEEAVFNLPMSADHGEQLGGGDSAGIETGEKVAGVGQQDAAVVGNYVPINTHSDLCPGKRQRFTNVTGVVQVEPQPAAFDGGPFFSTVCAAGGRSCAVPRHDCTASSVSG